MLALLEFLYAFFHIATAIRWLFSPSFRAEVAQDRRRYWDVVFGFVFIVVILIGLFYFLTRNPA
jgi:asparagine N-glycosylation enzyme membrane subunit Stt3